MASLKQQRIAAYNNIITKNKAKFKAGSAMTRQDFVKLFNIPGIQHKGSYANVHRSNLKLVQAQTEINTLMRENGLYLSSKGYYTEFYVRDKTYTKATIERMSSEVDTYSRCASRLETALTQRVKAGTWGTYNKVNSGVVSTAGNTPKNSVRHDRVINRLKRI